MKKKQLHVYVENEESAFFRPNELVNPFVTRQDRDKILMERLLETGKVKHRKPRGYTFDTVWVDPVSAADMSHKLESMGYITKIAKEKGSFFVYRKKVK